MIGIGSTYVEYLSIILHEAWYAALKIEKCYFCIGNFLGYTTQQRYSLNKTIYQNHQLNWI